MVTTLSKQDRDERVGAERLSARSSDLFVCAECRYAQPFAVQPRAVCTHQGSASAGRVLFAGQPACTDMSPRDGRELVLAMSAARDQKTRARFMSAPSLIR